MTFAVMLHGSASTFSPMFAVLFMIPVLLVFAPQPVRRDRRTIVGLGVALVAIVGVPVYAAICNVCAVCQTDMWWLYAECWFAK
jgi:hypothetical protein